MSEEFPGYEPTEPLPYIPHSSPQPVPSTRTDEEEQLPAPLLPPLVPAQSAPSTLTSPPVQRQGRSKLWISLGLLAVLLLASVASYLGIIYLNRSTPEKTLDVFCAALQQGDYRLAYSQFSPTLQRAVSAKTFAGILPQDPVTQCRHGAASDSENNATTDLRLVHASKKVNTDLVTLARGNGWKIDDVRRGAAQGKTPASSDVRHFDLPARQELRDFTADFVVGKGGADTGIPVTPGERIEIFATGSAGILPGVTREQSDPACRTSAIPAPSLPCYAIIYSIGVAGRAVQVGQHLDFTATAAGNIFLGVNVSGPTQASGSLHMTVLTIPPGTFSGIWAALADGFTFQGNAITLSILAFSQQNPILSVQFTEQVGQNATPLCSATSSVGATYSCQWNLRQRGTNYLNNGPITFGFTIFGSQGRPLPNPDGVRTGIARYVLTQSTDIYAGYAATNLNQETGYQKVTARWTVPPAHCSPGEDSSSAIWDGMTGFSQSSKLAQLGTASNCQSGVSQYEAGWEMFPDPLVVIPQTVAPGDIITASVVFQRGQFQLSMDDPRQHWHFAITQAGSATDTRIAECIVEAPTITVTGSGIHQSYVAQLTNFGRVSVSCQVDNGSIGNGPQNILYQMGNNGSKATTSELDRDGTTFTVQWKHG